MTRYLLDTNIVSDGLRAQPTPAISEWIGDQAAADLFISTLTIAEIWRGILELTLGRRRRALEAWFIGPEGPQRLFRDHVLGFDQRSAIEWGRIIAEGRLAGRPRSPIDNDHRGNRDREPLHCRDWKSAALRGGCRVLQSAALTGVKRTDLPTPSSPPF